MLFRSNKVIAQIPPEKDVDALTATNLGRLVLGAYDFAPCTPSGIMTILDNVCGSVSGANCVVIGRSNIVGKPMSIMLTQKNATVTLCHSHTEDLAGITSRVFGFGSFFGFSFLGFGSFFALPFFPPEPFPPFSLSRSFRIPSFS